MENITKALLIAAAILIAVMILSLVMMFYNEVSDYYQLQSDSNQESQLLEFNKKFENYNREKIRGNDMISLMNRVIDYNETQHYQSGTNYERIIVNIDIGTNRLDDFKYITSSNRNNYNFTYNSILPSNGKITNQSGTDDELISITTKINEIIANNSSLGITDANLQKLTANISNIVLERAVENSTSEYDVKTREKRISLLTSNLKLSKDDVISNLENIEKITCQYYEYTQFKRAYFDCTEVKYDKETGRVSEMKFEIRTDSSGNVEFD